MRHDFQSLDVGSVGGFWGTRVITMNTLYMALAVQEGKGDRQWVQEMSLPSGALHKPSPHPAPEIRITCFSCAENQKWRSR